MKGIYNIKINKLINWLYGNVFIYVYVFLNYIIWFVFKKCYGILFVIKWCLRDVLF